MSEPVAVAAIVPKDQRHRYVIQPLTPGGLMSVDLIGGQLRALGRLLKACARHDSDERWGAYLTQIETRADGTIEFSVAVLPIVKAEDAES